MLEITRENSDHRRFLRHLIKTNGKVKVGFDDDEFVTGVFDDYKKVSNAINIASQSGLSCFITLNPILESINAPNKLNPKPSEKKRILSIRDEHITKYTHIFFDIDAVRPKPYKKQPSTNEERQAAYHNAQVLQDMLEGLGWPDPIRGISGNGAHLIYRCDFDADLMAATLPIIYSELSEQITGFDPCVYNPSRFGRMYGTKNIKRETSPDRQNIYSVCKMPDNLDLVTSQAFFELFTPSLECHNNKVAVMAEKRRQAALARPKRSYNQDSKRPDISTLDVVSWLRAAGYYLNHVRNGMHAITCPWAANHSSKNRNETVVWEPDHASNHWPGFNCMHSCSGGIRDVMDTIGGWQEYCSGEYSHV